MGGTPLPQRLVEHLQKEENQLESVKQELQEALNHIQQLESFIEETSQQLKTGKTVPTENFVGIEENLKGTLEEVTDADNKLETVLEEIDGDRQSLMN